MSELDDKIRQVSGTACLLVILMSPRHLLLAFVLRDNDVFLTELRAKKKTKKRVQVCAT